MNVTELDPIVRSTFKRKLIASKYNPDNLLHSRFCCCSEDLCNSMTQEEIVTLFNITATSPVLSPKNIMILFTVFAHLPF